MKICSYTRIFLAKYTQISIIYFRKNTRISIRSQHHFIRCFVKPASGVVFKVLERLVGSSRRGFRRATSPYVTRGLGVVDNGNGPIAFRHASQATSALHNGVRSGHQGPRGFPLLVYFHCVRI